MSRALKMVANANRIFPDLTLGNPCTKVRRGRQQSISEILRIIWERKGSIPSLSTIMTGPQYRKVTTKNITLQQMVLPLSDLNVKRWRGVTKKLNLCASTSYSSITASTCSYFKILSYPVFILPIRFRACRVLSIPCLLIRNFGVSYKYKTQKMRMQTQGIVQKIMLIILHYPNTQYIIPTNIPERPKHIWRITVYICLL